MTSRYRRVVRVEATGAGGPSGRSRVWEARGGDLAGVRITFSVEATRAGKLATARIKLYNLSPESIAYLKTRRTVVRLLAGYEEGDGSAVGQIFIGDLSRVTVNRDSPDTIVSLEVTDGLRKYSTLRVSRSWSSTTALTVLRALAADGGYTLTIPAGISDVDLPEGWAVGGLWRTEFGAVVELLGMEWSIVDGRVELAHAGQAVERKAILLSDATGMIGRPSIGQRDAIVVKSLLLPTARPRRIIRVVSDDATGWYRVVTVRHEGDSGYEDTFYTTIEARRLRA